MAVVNIYDTLKPWPSDAKIKEIRIYQLLPCSVPSGGDAPHQTGMRIAEAQDSIVPARWVLGTVPVEADGSAHFKVPAYRELFFQLVDERGMAVQSMRSGTAVRDGEKLVCQGCHEPKHTVAAKSSVMPLAMLRAPSTPKPDVDGSNPFSYPRLVQPVLDRNCTECHEKNPKSPNLARQPIQNKWYASYNSLIKFAFTSYGAKNGWNDPLWYRTNPGKFGARASKLVQLLDKGHYDVKLSPEDFHRITLWLDSASMFYGVFEKETGEAQLRGDIVHATLE
jgi:cytochrome c553